MKANVLYGIGDLLYTDVPEPELKPGEVLVRVCAAGICGSDVARVFKTGTYHFPNIIGHEFAGKVCRAADESGLPWVDKRVSVFPLKPCFRCLACQAHQYEICANYDYLGSRCDGGFAEYVAVPVWNLLALPDEVNMEEAAMMEPTAVAMHALTQSGFKPGHKVAVFGPGTIGMILCNMARCMGAAEIYLVGRSQNKLEFARRHCDITDTYNLNDHEELIRLASRFVDIAFEGTGASASLSACLDIVKPGGTVVALGNPIGDVTLEKAIYWKQLRKQLRLVGTWNSRFGGAENDWTKALELVRSGRLALKHFITHRLPLNRLREGLEIMRNNEIYSNKIMLVNDGNQS